MQVNAAQLKNYLLDVLPKQQDSQAMVVNQVLFHIQ
jgi:hypothetical protein